MSRPVVKQKILVIDPQKVIAQSLKQSLTSYSITHVATAADAIVEASGTNFAAVVTELSLSGHSGFEFLYEFRSYADWRQIPIIVFSTVKLSDDVLKSRSWQALRIHDYLYKPSASLALLQSSLEKVVTPI